jgi:hypothetical protein
MGNTQRTARLGVLVLALCFLGIWSGNGGLEAYLYAIDYPHATEVAQLSQEFITDGIASVDLYVIMFTLGVWENRHKMGAWIRHALASAPATSEDLLDDLADELRWAKNLLRTHETDPVIRAWLADHP